MDKQKSMLEKYELLKTNINIYRVEPIQFEEEGSHEVDKISLINLKWNHSVCQKMD